MKNIKQLLYIPLLLLLGSCYEDLGNYDYQEINEVSIEGIEDHYSVLVGDELKIVPDLSFTLDKDANLENYSFEWYVINKGVLPSESYTAIASTKDLDFIMKLKPGNYDGYYKVTDKESGVHFTSRFELIVNTLVTEGWMVLGDVNGQARLDMAPRIEGEYRVIPNILDYVGSDLKLEGEPEFLYAYGLAPGVYGLYVTTSETGTTRVDAADLSWDDTYRLSFEMAIGVPLNFKADGIYRNHDWRNGRVLNSAYMVADGNVYYYYRKFNLYFGTPINKLSGEAQQFRASKYMSIGWQEIAYPIYFDEENQRFIRHLGNQDTESILLPELGGRFDSDIGMDLIYLGYSHFDRGEAVAVLFDDVSNQYYLAKITQRNRNQNKSYFTPVALEGFENAENFCIHPAFGYLFFNIGNKVYEYDFNKQEAIEMLDMGEKEVTYLGFNEFESTKSYTADYFNQLIVGVNDSAKPEGESGSLEFYDVPPVNGQITLNHSFEGFAKIKSVVYKER
ncbi:hypothetical protein GCM10028791_37490 [Echinicola sediminis]